MKYDLVVRRRDEAPAEKRESDEVGEEGERNERKDEPWPCAYPVSMKYKSRR